MGRKAMVGRWDKIRGVVLLIESGNFEMADGAVLNFVAKFEGITTDFAVLNEYLAACREVEPNFHGLPTIGTRKLLFLFHRFEVLWRVPFTFLQRGFVSSSIVLADR